MLHPTHTVVAKTVLRVLRNIIRDAKLSPLEGALVLSKYTVDASNGNSALILEISRLIRETAEEDQAEFEGRASPNVGPVAAPWNEDAGSGYPYDEETVPGN